MFGKQKLSVRKLLAILFGIGIIILCSLIVSLIPLNFTGDIVAKTAKQHNIEIISSNIWNLHLVNAETSTNKLEFQYHLNGNKINGRCDNFSYNLFSGAMYAEKIVVNLILVKKTDIAGLFNDIKEILQQEKKVYAFSSKNVIINVYKTDDSNKDNLSQEMILNDVEVVSNENVQKYRISIGIDKDRKMLFSYDKRNISADKYEINGEISNDNVACYLYDAKNGGNIDCYIKNLLYLYNDIIDDVVENNFFKQMLDKKINLKANIIHNNGTQVIGKMMINNDIGDFQYNLAQNILTLKFDNLFVNKTSNDIKGLDASEEDEILKKNVMSGQKHKSSLLINQNEMLENINTLNSVFMMLIQLSKNSNLELKINSNEVSFGDSFLSNFILNIKNKNGDLDIKEFSFNFGDSDIDGFRIKYVDGQIGNLYASGSSITQFNKYLYRKNIKNNKEIHAYQLSGDVKLGLDYIKLSDVQLITDGTKILNYDFSRRFNFEQKNTKTEERLTLQDVDFDEYFSLDELYKKLYHSFNDYQNVSKQEATLWRMLFEKKLTNSIANASKVAIVLNNVIFAGTMVHNFVYTKNEINHNLDINIIANSSVLDGKMDLFVGTKAERDGIFANLNFNNLDLNQMTNLKRKIENSIGLMFNDVLLIDKDYNIPSFLGINGDIKVVIKNLIANDNIVKDINTDISIRDGNVYVDNLKMLYKSSKIDINSIISLQGRPDIQLAVAGSGFNLNDIIASPLDGYLSFQISLRSGGFNPIRLINNIQGNGQYIVQNLQIPNFNLLGLSKQVISNGIQKDLDYYDIIAHKKLAFSQGAGNLLFTGSSVKGDFSASRELVSGSGEFEYNFGNKIVKTASGSFAMIMTRKPADKPFPIYIPYACSGKANSPDCLVNWGQLHELIGQTAYN